MKYANCAREKKSRRERERERERRGKRGREGGREIWYSGAKR
jgi:hypothetical protein